MTTLKNDCHKFLLPPGFRLKFRKVDLWLVRVYENIIFSGINTNVERTFFLIPWREDNERRQKGNLLRHEGIRNCVEGFCALTQHTETEKRRNKKNWNVQEEWRWFFCVQINVTMLLQPLLLLLLLLLYSDFLLSPRCLFYVKIFVP